MYVSCGIEWRRKLDTDATQGELIGIVGKKIVSNGKGAEKGGSIILEVFCDTITYNLVGISFHNTPYLCGFHFEQLIWGSRSYFSRVEN